MSLRSILAAVLTLAVTAALLAYAFWDVDVASLGHLLAAGNYWTLLPFEILLVLFYGFTALGWRIILRPVGRFSLWQITPAMMIGFGGNNVLPAHMGELVRIAVFALRHGCSRTAVMATLVLERLLDVFAILLLYMTATLTMGDLPEAVRAGFWGTAAVLGIAALAILSFLAFPAKFHAAWDLLSRPLPARLARVGTKLIVGAEAGLSALRSPAMIPLLIGFSLAKWSSCAGMVWLSLWGYGESVTPGLAVLVVAATALAVSLPSVPGFFGVMQAAFVFALTPFGVSREVALASSVFFLLAQWVPVTAFGLTFFFTTGLDLRRVRREVEQG